MQTKSNSLPAGARTQTKVTKSITHDRLAVKAKFPSGGEIGFSITRGGERLSFAGANDRKTFEIQSRAVQSWIKGLQKQYTNGEVIGRMAALFAECDSVAGLVAILPA